MKTTTRIPTSSAPEIKQQGVVLFFALLAMLALSLAAVALVRSVDTNTMISGNIAFKQSSVNSADAGIENAITWLLATDGANANLYTDPSNPLNNDDAAHGYYSSASSAVSLTNGYDWDNNSKLVAANTSEKNEIRYVIQRMCRLADKEAENADCLFGDVTSNSGETTAIKKADEVCEGLGCNDPNVPIQYRVTARSEAPRNSISYVQAFVY